MKAAFGIPNLVSGILLMILAGLVVLGGIKRIASVTEKLVPFMAIFYIIGAVILCAVNGDQIIPALASIFKGAFAMKAVGGGVVGSGVKNGSYLGHETGSILQ